MLSALSAPVFSGIELLQEAISVEADYRLVEFSTIGSLRFSDSSSLASKFYWSQDALEGLARQTHPSLYYLAVKFPAAATKGCVEACLPFIAKRLHRFPVKVVAKGDFVCSVAGCRALQVPPSTVLRSLVNGKIKDVLVDYDRFGLTATFINDETGREPSALAVRSILARGWALERADGHLDAQGEVRLGKFSRWVIADWESAFFSILSRRYDHGN